MLSSYFCGASIIGDTALFLATVDVGVVQIQVHLLSWMSTKYKLALNWLSSGSTRSVTTLSPQSNNAKSEEPERKRKRSEECNTALEEGRCGQCRVPLSNARNRYVFSHTD